MTQQADDMVVVRSHLFSCRGPHALRQVIAAVRPMALTSLFVACDGPNPERPDEAEKAADTRQVIVRLYSDANQAWCFGVSRANTCFSEQVEEVIILEVDCVLHPGFFPYCPTLLAQRA